MTPLSEIRDAAVGWLDMIGGRPGGGERFDRGTRGFGTALGFYFLMVLFTIAVQGAAGGFPGFGQIALAILVNALPLVAIALVIWATVHVLRPDATVGALLVPAVYALAFILLIGLPLSLFFGNIFANAMMGVLAYMLYRLARDVGKLRVGVAVAFAILGIGALVALPIGLYMVTMPAIPAS